MEKIKEFIKKILYSKKIRERKEALLAIVPPATLNHGTKMAITQGIYTGVCHNIPTVGGYYAVTLFVNNIAEYSIIARSININGAKSKLLYTRSFGTDLKEAYAAFNEIRFSPEIKAAFDKKCH